MYCESLLNKSSYTSQPNQDNKKIRTFEQLVISKHHLHRIFFDPKKVEKFYLKRHTNNKWDHNGERDDKDFIQVEKDIYLEIFPHNKAVFWVEEEGEEPSNDSAYLVLVFRFT